MKKTLLAATALTALSFSAFAADLPKRNAPAAPAPVFTWAGAYVGGSVGATVSNTNFHDYDDYFDNQMQAGHTSFGAAAGLYAGYNFQRQNLVYGVEASGNFMTGKLTVYPFASSESMSARTAWNATLKARVGLALDKTLVYIAAGPSITSSKISMNIEDLVSSKTSNVFGAAFAVGVEQALSDKLVARVQLEHVASAKSKNAVACSGCRGGFTRSTTTVSVGLAYKF